MGICTATVYFPLLLIVLTNALNPKATVGPLTDPALSDEWIGPLDDWKYVTRDYGAKGDGITDDWAALQAAFNATDHNTFMYLPAGTYRVTKGFNMTSQHNSAIIGEDPLTTIILYDGPDCLDNNFTCVLLYTNGVGSMRFSRVTWNGQNKIHTLVQNRWDGCVNGYSGDGVHQDEIFTNALFGLRAGSNHGPYCGGNGATAEWTVTRCHFENLTSAGYSVEDWNALDWFIRQSIFINVYIGITDIYGCGGVHGYENQFFHTYGADFAYGNCGYFAIRDNFSYNTSRFLLHGDGGCSNQFSIQNNIVIGSETTLLNGSALIFIGSPDVATILDNVLVTPLNYQGPVIIWDGPYVGYAASMSINNSYCVNGTIEDAVKFNNLEKTTHRGFSINDTNYAPGTLFWTQPTIPGFQPPSTRPIFTLPPPSPNVNTSQIQSVIDEALAYTGKRAIIYLPIGRYMINDTIVIPPNSDITILGRERASWWDTNFGLASIEWHGAEGLPIIHLQGPSKATIMHITLNAMNIADAIWITNADQEGARIYIEDLDPYGPLEHSLYANYVDNVHIEIYGMWIGGITNSTSILSVGGPCSDAGTGKSYFAGFGGGTSANTGTGSLYDVKNGGSLLTTDAWYEGPGMGWMQLNNSKGNLTFASGNVSPYHDISNTITINGFEGNFLLNEVSLSWNVSVYNLKNDSNILFAAVSFLNSYIHEQGNTGELNVVLSNLNPDGNPNDLKLYINDTLHGNNSADISRILNAFSLLRTIKRSYPEVPATYSPAGVTDVRLYRNWEIAARTAVYIEGDLNQTVCATPKRKFLQENGAMHRQEGAIVIIA